jgi:hypothetical protein
MPLFDVGDFKKFKAVLHEDGGGFSLVQPTPPCFIIKEASAFASQP